MGLPEILTELAAVQEGVTGIKRAYAYPPEKLGQFPSFVNYPGSGRLTGVGTVGKGYHTIICELHVTRGHLPVAFETAVGLVQGFWKALAADIKLNGTVEAITEIRYEIISFVVSETESNLGVRFEVDVKESDQTVIYGTGG